MISTTSRWQLVTGVAAILLALGLSIFAGINTVSTFILVAIGIAQILLSFSTADLRNPEEIAPAAEYSAGSWPIVTALSVPFFVYGASEQGVFVVLAAAIALVGGIGWLGSAWRAEEGYSKEFADRFSERIFRPILLPLFALVIVASVAISVSRILLAVTENAAVVIAMVLGAAVLTAFAFLSAAKRTSRGELRALGILAFVLVIGAGSAAANAINDEEIISGSAFQNIKADAVNKQFVKFGTGMDEKPKPLGTVTAIVGKEARFTLQNDEQDVPDNVHNMAVYEQSGKDKDGKAIYGRALWNGTAVPRGKTAVNYWTPAKTGRFQLRCDFHATMMAWFDVKNGAGD